MQQCKQKTVVAWVSLHENDRTDLTTDERLEDVMLVIDQHK